VERPAKLKRQQGQLAAPAPAEGHTGQPDRTAALGDAACPSRIWITSTGRHCSSCHFQLSGMPSQHASQRSSRIVPVVAIQHMHTLTPIIKRCFITYRPPTNESNAPMSACTCAE
jgi:hypothetical protein